MYACVHSKKVDGVRPQDLRLIFPWSLNRKARFTATFREWQPSPPANPIKAYGLHFLAVL